MASYLLCLVILCLSLQAAHAETETYYFQDSCVYDIHDIDDDDTYYVEWDGTEVEFSSCSIGFHGFSFDSLDQYKVCVEAESFYISFTDRDVKLIYEHKLSDDIVKETGYGGFPSRWCSGSDEYVDVVLSGADMSSSGTSRFRLKVTAVKTYGDSSWIYISVGSGIGGIVMLIFVVAVIVRCIRYKSLTRQYPALRQDTSQAYNSINTGGNNIYQSPYGVENPSTINTYPKQNSYSNGTQYGYPNTAPATPPPPYTVSKEITSAASGQ